MARYLWFPVGVALLGADVVAQSPMPSGLDQHVEWQDPLFLEEVEGAMSARPRLALDPRGGFLVTDNLTKQVRVYDEFGSLITFFGREGDGPGEFKSIQGVARLASGELCTVDFQGRVAVWSEDGTLIDDVRGPEFRGAMGVVPNTDRRVTVVMAPVRADVDTLVVPWVQELDLNTREPGRRILSLALSLDNVNTASSVGGDVDATLGQRFGLTWTIFDSLWAIDLERTPQVEVIQLESDLLGQNTEYVDRFDDREGFVEWMLAATFPGAVFPTPDRGWLVTMFKRQGRDNVFSLLRLNERGERQWEVTNTPRLVAVDPTGLMYFHDTSGMQPNRFERARLRN